MSIKHLGLIAVFILYSGAAFVVWRWPQGKHATLSQHVALRRQSILYYILLFTVVLSLLIPFFFYWFMPTFEISVWFGVFIAIAAVAQYACTLIPEIGGWKTRYHRLLAGISAVSLVPASILLLFTDTVSGIGKLLTLVGLVIMVSIATLLLKGNGQHSHFLILQFCYFGAFFVPVLFIIYF